MLSDRLRGAERRLGDDLGGAQFGEGGAVEFEPVGKHVAAVLAEQRRRTDLGRRVAEATSALPAMRGVSSFSRRSNSAWPAATTLNPAPRHASAFSGGAAIRSIPARFNASAVFMAPEGDG